jgi:hypothetical protein
MSDVKKSIRRGGGILFKVTYSTGEFLDFRLAFKISAFLFAGLIFFVTFFYQEKKVKSLYFERNFKPIYLTFDLLKGNTDQVLFI